MWLGRQLLCRLGLFHHVRYEHTFQDDYLFYRSVRHAGYASTDARDEPTAAVSDKQYHLYSSLRGDALAARGGVDSALCCRDVDAMPKHV